LEARLMAAKIVDDQEAIRLHRDDKLTVAQIAIHFGVRNPAIYRAFTRGGYAYQTVCRLRPQKPHRPIPAQPRGKLPPSRVYPADRHVRDDFHAEEEAVAARRIMPRDPCQRCGTRADHGCKHRAAPPLGWRVG
jgi:hypothetical protein